MDRQQLAHILRAACDVTGNPDAIVLGSQSILGTYDEDELPPAATMSMEPTWRGCKPLRRASVQRR